MKGAFLSPDYNGKKGTWIMMADGSVRFLTKDVNPAVFKALCTITGDDDGDVSDLDAIAPRATLPTWGGKPVAPKTQPKNDAKEGEKKTTGTKTEEEEKPGK